MNIAACACTHWLQLQYRRRSFVSDVNNGPLRSGPSSSSQAEAFPHDNLAQAATKQMKSKVPKKQNYSNYNNNSIILTLSSYIFLRQEQIIFIYLKWYYEARLKNKNQQSSTHTFVCCMQSVRSYFPCMN